MIVLLCFVTKQSNKLTQNRNSVCKYDLSELLIRGTASASNIAQYSLPELMRSDILVFTLFVFTGPFYSLYPL